VGILKDGRPITDPDIYRLVCLERCVSNVLMRLQSGDWVLVSDVAQVVGFRNACLLVIQKWIAITSTDPIQHDPSGCGLGSVGPAMILDVNEEVADEYYNSRYLRYATSFHHLLSQLAPSCAARACNRSWRVAASGR
jgi:hypothetical protein